MKALRNVLAAAGIAGASFVGGQASAPGDWHCGPAWLELAERAPSGTVADADPGARHSVRCLRDGTEITRHGDGTFSGVDAAGNAIDPFDAARMVE